MAELTRDESIAKLRELIKDVNYAMLTTAEPDGHLRSRPMGTQQIEFDGATLWFFTADDSAKAEEVAADRHVNVAYSKPDDQIYVSVSGTAQIVKDQEKMKELWNPILKAWFPKGLEDPHIALLRVSVHKAEYWDAPSSKLVQLAGFVKAIATGKPYEGTGVEHDKLTVS